MGNKKEEKIDLDEIVDQVNLGERSEMGEVADQIFLTSPSRSNVTAHEKSVCFVNNIIFGCLGMDESNPVNMFLELNKSREGWATEKLVQSIAGVNDNRSGGMLGNLRDSLFKRKD